MRLVVDASVIIQLSLAGTDLGPLRGHELVAPPLLASEVTSTLSEMAYRGDLPLEAARAAMVVARGLPVSLAQQPGHHEAAWDLAQSLGWAKTYDAEYVVLARALGAPLVTIDERLRRRVGHLVEMPALMDIQPDRPLPDPANNFR